MALNYQKYGKDLTQRSALGKQEHLFNSMGEKEYRSSEKVQISVSLRKLPKATSENTAIRGDEIESYLTHRPSQTIGAVIDAENRSRMYSTRTFAGAVIPVDGIDAAVEQSKLVQDWFVKEVKRLIPVINVKNKQISWEQYQLWLEKISLHNREIGLAVTSELDAAERKGALRKKLRAALMANRRWLLSTYCVDISISIAHNVYSSYFENNFTDEDEARLDYFINDNKKWSKNVTKVISIPVGTIEELNNIYNLILNSQFEFNKIKMVSDRDIIELAESPKDEAYHESDRQLALELGFIDETEEIIESDYNPSLIDDIFKEFNEVFDDYEATESFSNDNFIIEGDPIYEAESESPNETSDNDKSSFIKKKKKK